MNNFNRKQYTRMEKIRYFIKTIADQVPKSDNQKIEKAFGALDYLTSERYIDKETKHRTEETIKKVSKRKYKKGA